MRTHFLAIFRHGSRGGAKSLKFTVKFWNLENITEILLFGKQ
jgi:hypothetical protein